MNNASKMLVYKLIGIICLSTLPFIFSLRGDFVFDDSLAVVQNKDVTSESWTVPFHNDFWGTNITSVLSHKSYRPLTVGTFRLNYYLNGKHLSATQFKVTNLISHVISSLLSWAVFEVIFKDITKPNCYKWRNSAYQCSLLFAVHPVHTEAVCGIVGRADILAAITFFLAFLSYRKAMYSQYGGVIYLFLTGFFAAASMLFKENGITVLGVCVLYEIIINLLKHKEVKCEIRKQSIIRIKCLAIFITFLLYNRFLLMGGVDPIFKKTDNPAYFSNNLLIKIATYNYIYFINLLLLIWPHWLCYDWSMGCIPLITSLLDYRIILIMLMYTYGVLAVIKMLHKYVSVIHKRLMTISFLLLVIPFLPAANIFFPVGFVVAERILYIPSTGYCLLFVVGLKNIHHLRFAKRLNKNFIFWFIIVFYILRTWQRSYEWQNEYKLFYSGLKVCPLNAKVHYNIAKVADAASDYKKAMSAYKEAIRLNPEYSEAMNNLGNLLKDTSYLADSEYYLRKALQYKPDSAATWMNLGIVLSRLGNNKESLDAYNNALSYRKNYPMCYFNLGNLYLDMNKTNEAAEMWLQAIKLNATHSLAWTNLLALLDNTSQLERAVELIPQAIQMLPESGAVNFAIANIYGKLQRYNEAEQFFLNAIRLFDKKVQAIHYSNLGVLYHRWKKFELAADMYTEALKIDPTFENARKQLRRLRKV